MAARRVALECGDLVAPSTDLCRNALRAKGRLHLKPGPTAQVSISKTNTSAEGARRGSGLQSSMFFVGELFLGLQMERAFGALEPAQRRVQGARQAFALQRRLRLHNCHR